jgi:hypothetical protein
MVEKLFIVTEDEVAKHVSAQQSRLLDTFEALVAENPDVSVVELLNFTRENYVLKPTAVAPIAVAEPVVEEPVEVPEAVEEEPVYEDVAEVEVPEPEFVVEEEPVVVEDEPEAVYEDDGEEEDDLANQNIAFRNNRRYQGLLREASRIDDL